MEKYWDNVLDSTNVLPRKINPNNIDIEREIKFYTSPEIKYAYKCMGNIEGKRILEIGSGLGINTLILARKGAYVDGIDISGGRVKWARKLISKYGLDKRAKFSQMSAEKLNFESESFDIVCGKDILMYTDPTVVGKNIFRILKKDGQVIIIEALKYHPGVAIYRNTFAPREWKKFTHYLTIKEVERFGSIFSRYSHKEYYLLAFFSFYWSLIRKDINKFIKSMTILYPIDEKILRILPWIRNFCWRTVIVCTK